jgi:hypothetical protein
MDLLWTDLRGMDMYTSLEKVAGLGLEGSRGGSLEVAVGSLLEMVVGGLLSVAGGTEEDEVEGPIFFYFFFMSSII